jgi:hypothetical protein
MVEFNAVELSATVDRYFGRAMTDDVEFIH